MMNPRTASWSPQRLEDIVWSLKITLSRVPPEKLAGTSSAEMWTKIHVWLVAAERELAQSEGKIELGPVPQFPLSGTQLREFQKTIDRRSRQLSADTRSNPMGEDLLRQLKSAPPVTARGVIRASFRGMEQSSLRVAGALVVLLVVGLLNLVLYLNSPTHIVIGLAAMLLLTLLALTLWGTHHLRLIEHHHKANTEFLPH